MAEMSAPAVHILINMIVMSNTNGVWVFIIKKHGPQHFFFSSIRRHTRSLCDWSSDVCSSDLNLALAMVCDPTAFSTSLSVGSSLIYKMSRSEERRVGKECRSRWWPYDSKKKDKLCLIFKLAPSVCRMTFPILSSLMVRLFVLLPFQLLRLSLATPSRWTPLALSVFLHCVVALLLTLL